jgi:hypothetical protein
MRNMYFDLNELCGCKIHCAQVVESATTPNEYFLHLLVEDDDEIQSLSNTNPYAYEYVDDLPDKMKESEGGPKHVYAGVCVYKNKDERLTVSLEEK